MRWAALLMLTGLVACGRGTPPEETKAEPAAGTPSEVTFTADQIAHGGVRWAAVVATPLADFVELTGRLVIDEDHTARVSPSVKGRVTVVRVNVGDAVSQGQTLVILQSEEASARRAELAKASAELTERQATRNYARATRERAERLLALKAGSAQDVERARADEATAEAGASQSQSAVEHARTTLSVLEVDTATGQIYLASPITGVVVARDAVAGAVIDAGASALTVTDASSLWLEFGAPDHVASLLTPGQRIHFDVPGLPGSFDATVLRVNGTLDTTTRLVTVRAAVANASKKLRPEMFATVRAETAAPRPAVTVPHDAVQLLDERPCVFLATPDGHGGAVFIRRDVQTGTTANGQTHITSGVIAGDVVVTDGAFAIKSQFSRGKMPAGG
ncbi:MAG: efflux RND transporter periplasmic adaptor subunit [Vicinamibacterales bacterium]